MRLDRLPKSSLKKQYRQSKHDASSYYLSSLLDRVRETRGSVAVSNPNPGLCSKKHSSISILIEPILIIEASINILAVPYAIEQDEMELGDEQAELTNGYLIWAGHRLLPKI